MSEPGASDVAVAADAAGSDVTARLSALEEENAALRAEQEAATELEEELHKEVQSLEQRLQDEHRQVEALRQELAASIPKVEAEHLRERYHEAANELQKAQTNLLALERMRDTLSEKDKTVAQLVEERASLGAAMEEMRASVAKLQAAAKEAEARARAAELAAEEARAKGKEERGMCSTGDCVVA